MRSILLCLIFALLAASTSSANPDSTETTIHWTVGVLYDQISQDYYLSQIDTLAIDEDSLMTLRKTSDDTNVPRIKLRMDLIRPFSGQKSLTFSNVAFVSDEDLRNNLTMELDLGNVDIDNELQVRAILDDDKTSNTGYVSNLLNARFRPLIGNGTFFVSRNSFEIVKFDGTDDFNYDYNYSKNYVGIEKEFGLIDYASFGYRLDHRFVADSSRLDLTRHRLLCELNWSPSMVIAFDIQNEFSRILSAKEDNLDDGWEEYLDGALTIYPGADWTLRLRDQFEYAVFDTQDVVNFDYIYNTAEVTISKRPSLALEIFMRPSLMTFWSRSTEFQAQDYDQLALEYGADLYPGNGLWLSASHKIGKRDYTYEADAFYTDYTLNRLNLYADMKVYGNLRFSTIVSVDWENHESDGDDNTLSMITAGLDLRF